MYGGAFGNKQDSVFPNLEVSWQPAAPLGEATPTLVSCLSGGSAVLVLPSGLAGCVLARLQRGDWSTAGAAGDGASVPGRGDSGSAEAQRVVPGPAGVPAALRPGVGTPPSPGPQLGPRPLNCPPSHFHRADLMSAKEILSGNGESVLFTVCPPSPRSQWIVGNAPADLASDFSDEVIGQVLSTMKAQSVPYTAIYTGLRPSRVSVGVCGWVGRCPAINSAPSCLRRRPPPCRWKPVWEEDARCCRPEEVTGRGRGSGRGSAGSRRGPASTLPSSLR